MDNKELFNKFAQEEFYDSFGTNWPLLPLHAKKCAAIADAERRRFAAEKLRELVVEVGRQKGRIPMNEAVAQRLLKRVSDYATSLIAELEGESQS